MPTIPLKYPSLQHYFIHLYNRLKHMPFIKRLKNWYDICRSRTGASPFSKPQSHVFGLIIINNFFTSASVSIPTNNKRSTNLSSGLKINCVGKWNAYFYHQRVHDFFLEEEHIYNHLRSESHPSLPCIICGSINIVHSSNQVIAYTQLCTYLILYICTYYLGDFKIINNAILLLLLQRIISKYT